MRPTAQQLAMRDPALASLLGVGAMSAGADFGFDDPAYLGEVGFSGESDGSGAEFGVEFGQDDYGEMGVEFGVLDGAIPPPPPPPQGPLGPTPPPAQLAAFYHSHMAAQSQTRRRQMVLEPNFGSNSKIQRFNMNVNIAVTLGTPLAGFTQHNNPTNNFRPQRVTTNAPQPNFVYLNTIQVSNLNAIIGGFADAYQFIPQAQGMSLDLPTITPAIPVTIQGSYTGVVPPGFTIGTALFFTVGMNGPASMTA